jgi:hypothetical protein
VKSLVNDPKIRASPALSAQLRQNLELGLTTDTVARTADIGLPLAAAQVANFQNLIELTKAEMSLRPVKTKQGMAYQVHARKPVSVMCFDPTIGAHNPTGLIPPEYTCSAMTAAHPPPDQTSAEQEEEIAGGKTPFGFKEAARAAGPAVTYRLYPRSTFDILRYFGSLALIDIQKRRYIPLVTPHAVAIGTPIDPISTSLFFVRKERAPVRAPSSR